MRKNSIYFPGLNGLRAISAIAVVISHITLGLKDFNLNPYIFGTFQDGSPKGLSLAGYGVSIFFVLSGFLITYLLFAEKAKQSINIKKFYARRILRIWPLYYLYLTISILIIASLGINLNVKSLSLYLFYAANIPFILGTTLPFLAHYWSLGVEEQFYLFWPWLVKIFNKSLILIILILILVLIGGKVFLHFIFPYSILESVIHITRFHCMMIGALGSILYKTKNILFLKITNNKVSQTICWIILLLVLLNKFHIASIIDNEIISVVALFLIIGQIEIKNRIINLELKPFDFLGKVSYGIYVIHPLIIFLFSKIPFPFEIGTIYKYLIVYALILGTTILVSFLSFKYYESYFLKLKKRFVVVKSSSSMTFENEVLPIKPKVVLVNDIVNYHPK